MFRNRSAALRRPAAGAVYGTAIAALLGTAIGASLPALALHRATVLRPTPFADAAVGLGGGEVPWLPGWTHNAVGPDQMMDAGLRSLAAVLLWLALLLVALGLVNAATVLLLRVRVRWNGYVMRVVLGASWTRLARPVWREAVRPGVGAAAIGAALGGAGLAVASGTWPGAIPRSLGLPVDGRVIGLGVLVPLGLLVAVGLHPLRVAWERRLAAHLTVGARATAGPGETALRRTLAIVSIAGSVTLVIACGLLLRGSVPDSAPRLRAEDARSTLTLRMLPAGPARGAEAQAALNAALLDRVRAVPGVVDTSLATPDAWYGLGTRDLLLYMLPPPPPGAVAPPGLPISALQGSVSPGFFRAIGAPLVRGRDFTAGDSADAARVIVVNESFAHRLGIGRDPLGRRFQLGYGGYGKEWYTLVGVVRDVRAPGIGTPTLPTPAVYFSALQHPPTALDLVVRTTGDPETVAAGVAGAAARSGMAAVGAEMTLAERLARFRAPLRWLGQYAAALAGASLLVGIAGVATLMSYTVATRRREIGVRMALGASPRGVVALLLWESLRVTGKGLVLGLAGALCVGRALQVLFHGVEMFDPAVYAAVLLLLGVTGVLAALRAAFQAARVDPALALRA